MDVEQNAHLFADAEQYYRAMRLCLLESPPHAYVRNPRETPYL